MLMGSALLGSSGPWILSDPEVSSGLNEAKSKMAEGRRANPTPTPRLALGKQSAGLHGF